MKIFSFGAFKIIFAVTLCLFSIIAANPFQLIDMKQAERIAKWKSDFEQIKYCYALAVLYEGAVKDASGYDEDIADELLITKIKPYFQFLSDRLTSDKTYRYRRRNGRYIPKHSQFYFDKFIENKNGALISFKKNQKYKKDEDLPLYYMFFDINGREKPNKTGEDIFFTALFPDKIAALGYDKNYSKLKQNCSPVSSGFYCSEFYLLGGNF